MQHNASILPRPNLSESVVIALRRMIVDGTLPAGDRINEVELSRSLGISRTPLREALGYLVAEKALKVVPRHGYYVCPLTFDEFKDIYCIRPILDPEALRLAGIPLPERLDRLEELNRRIGASNDLEKAINLDDQWHLNLLDGCPNRELIALIAQNMARTRRYEMALMRERSNVRNATDEHLAIIEALRAGNLDAACDALRRNMQSGFEPITAWLRSRETP